ncbi:hypothetical protein RRG08_044605 [Elysia crispata]|uniref:Uncharacterized protein n=1 Tax=Elysia crispata TaxID=231223 RepID=A0AAE0YMJ3_9GAST|nr:hypothetical protein RRG08_044605 [Elysia crispata]
MNRTSLVVDHCLVNHSIFVNIESHQAFLFTDAWHALPQVSVNQTRDVIESRVDTGQGEKSGGGRVEPHGLGQTIEAGSDEDVLAVLVTNNRRGRRGVDHVLFRVATAQTWIKGRCVYIRLECKFKQYRRKRQYT